MPCLPIQDKALVRVAAITLFGNLAKFGDGPSRETFLEQVHTNLVSLLLHLNDPEEDVRKVRNKMQTLTSLTLAEN